MSGAVGIGLPLLITLAMIVVGLELTVDDLKRVAHYPLHVVSALLVQIVVLPLLAFVLIRTLHPGPAVVAGLILTAAAPQAISSNVFCLLARADVALSVTLTAVSSALASPSPTLAASNGGRRVNSASGEPTGPCTWHSRCRVMPRWAPWRCLAFRWCWTAVLQKNHRGGRDACAWW